MHMSDENRNAPRNESSATRRTDLRTLLRSRSVQAVLVAAGIMQAIAATGKHEVTTAEAREAALAAAPEPVRLVPVSLAPAAPKLEKLASVADLQVQPRTEAEKSAASAAELAREYSRKGYKVTPTLAAKIHEAAVENDIDPAVAFGLVRAESGFRNSATSPVGAVGLMQLMPATAAWMEPGVTRKELRDSETNLRVGFKYLRYLIEKYDGNERLALLAYNRGPGTVDRALKRGRNPDNGYVDFVLGKENHGHTLYTRKR